MVNGVTNNSCARGMCIRVDLPGSLPALSSPAPTKSIDKQVQVLAQPMNT